MPRERVKKEIVFKYSELSEKAKERALDQCCGFNVSHRWWEFVFEDAERIGLKITEFDIDRENFIRGNLTRSAFDCAELIEKEHGVETDTAKLARNFLYDVRQGAKAHKENVQDDFDFSETQAYEDLCTEFERALKEEYLHMLRREFEYLTSHEAIEETIKANDYEFFEDGKIA